MERSTWTDERLDDMAAASNVHFERLWAETQQLRTDMNTELREMRAEMNTELREMRAEMNTEMREMRAEMHAGFEAIRRDMFHGAIALFGSQAALFAVLVVQAL